MNSTNGAPYMFDYINTVNGSYTPSMIHVQDNKLTYFFAKYLLQKVMSVYKWTIPDTWDKDYFLYTLYTYGYIAVVNTDKFGVIPQQCGLSGWNVFYRPTHALISNPLLTGTLQPVIDKQCVVMKLQGNYGSFMDLVFHYAGLMALSSETATKNLFNSQFSYVAFAGNKAEAETFKSAYDDMVNGSPLVVLDKSLKSKTTEKPNWAMFDQNVGQNYIVGDILTDLRKWEENFLTTVGIENANTDKKERLVVAEVDSNNEEAQTLASLWLENMQESVTKVNAMFNLNISVDWRVKPTTNEEPELVKEGVEDE